MLITQLNYPKPEIQAKQNLYNPLNRQKRKSGIFISEYEAIQNNLTLWCIKQHNNNGFIQYGTRQNINLPKDLTVNLRQLDCLPSILISS
jgi:hypothetical protein